MIEGQYHSAVITHEWETVRHFTVRFGWLKCGFVQAGELRQQVNSFCLCVGVRREGQVSVVGGSNANWA